AAKPRVADRRWATLGWHAPQCALQPWKGCRGAARSDDENEGDHRRRPIIFCDLKIPAALGQPFQGWIVVFAIAAQGRPLRVQPWALLPNAYGVEGRTQPVLTFATALIG